MVCVINREGKKYKKGYWKAHTKGTGKWRSAYLALGGVCGYR